MWVVMSMRCNTMQIDGGRSIYRAPPQPSSLVTVSRSSMHCQCVLVSLFTISPIGNAAMGVDSCVDRGHFPLLSEAEGTFCVSSPYFFGDRIDSLMYFTLYNFEEVILKQHSCSKIKTLIK